jgi:hypothetical protein
MNSSQQTATEKEIQRFFREVVLCLGGIFAVREVEDDLVWQVARSLDRIYLETRARVCRSGNGAVAQTAQRRLERHPALVHLLDRIETEDWKGEVES